jgi:catechol 2,3-dioxygenase-like lactoylglutathione lyase family enzyme
MSETAAAAVSLRGLNHVGIPVRDLRRSLAWYREMFGIEPEFVVEAEGPETSAAVQLEDARVTAAFLDVGGSYLELLQYHNPVGEDFTLRNCDVGAVHVCLVVDSIHAAYERLLAGGANFSAPPAKMEEGALAGYSFAYFRDPDGIQFELFELPG